jgi:hypothetical protein
LEQIQKLLTVIVVLHIKSDAGGELPIEVLNHVGKFTEYFSWPYITYHTDKGYQDPSQNPRVCGGPAKGQQSEKLLSPG